MRNRFLLLNVVLAALAAVALPSLAAYPDKVISHAVRERFKALGADTDPSTPEEFRELSRRETEKWAKVIKFSGAKVD